MKRKALCIGINKFKNYASAALQGCVNDANMMSSILMDYYGFQADEITVLTDEQATKQNIMNHLTQMVEGAKQGQYNQLVFSLSSHGTQVVDLNGDEEDGLDEAFCPHDLAQKGNAWDPNHIIIDAELYNLFTQLPKEVQLEAFMDTCHSGTGLKSIDFLLTRRPRFMPPPSYEHFHKAERALPYAKNKIQKNEKLNNHILWSGCKANQTSADALINNNWHGAFTYYFNQEIRANNDDLNREQLLRKIRTQLRNNHYSQVPQLDENATTRNKKINKKETVENI
ncbi:MAG: caspase family protein [Marinifilaceae bacterium]